jgi:hypothetical protein
VPQEDRADLLGHAHESMNRHYSAPDIQRLREQAEKVVDMNQEPVVRVTGKVPQNSRDLLPKSPAMLVSG